MKVNIKTGKKARIEMLPLIDIVFLLLVFFIYAMLSMAVHKGIPVTLPSSATAETARIRPVAVTLKADNTIFLDRVQVSLEEISDAIRAETMNHERTEVLLFADRTVPYQSVFQIMDQIRNAGIRNISLQAEAD